MAEMILLEWVSVNSYMRDDYRLLVAAMAARQVKEAPTELQMLARTAFGTIPVPGARSFFRADLIQQRKALAKTMQTQAQVASIVVALWALAADSYLNLLKQSGETAGLQFDRDYGWEKGMQGFYDFEQIPLLSALADGLGEKMQDKDYDHLKLAALWLGPAVSNTEALTVKASDDTAEQEFETATSTGDE